MQRNQVVAHLSQKTVSLAVKRRFLKTFKVPYHRQGYLWLCEIAVTCRESNISIFKY